MRIRMRIFVRHLELPALPQQLLVVVCYVCKAGAEGIPLLQLVVYLLDAASIVLYLHISLYLCHSKHN